MATQKVVGCKGCKRAVYAEHVDRNGMCVLCVKEVEKPKDVSPVSGDSK